MTGPLPSFSRKCLLNIELNNQSLSVHSGRNGVPWNEWLVRLATQTIIKSFPLRHIFSSHTDSLGTAKHSMSCHKIAVRCRTAVLTGLSDRFLRAFVSFLVNSCQFSLPTVFIKLSFLSSSTFLHLTSFRKRNQITKYGWKFVLKKTSQTLSPSKKNHRSLSALASCQWQRI